MSFILNGFGNFFYYISSGVVFAERKYGTRHSIQLETVRFFVFRYRPPSDQKISE